MNRYKYVNSAFLRSIKNLTFTNGCFDLFHVGHLRTLEWAKEQGPFLCVASDESIKRLKGNDRPIHKLEDRMALLAGLSCVDYVISFEEDTPECLMDFIIPAKIVKGGDYAGKLSGDILIAPYYEGYSTTRIINGLRET